MAPKTLFVLCGVPGSGKTTLAKELAKMHNAKLYSYDDMPNADIPKHAREVRNQMLTSIAEDLRNGFSVVCDDTNTRIDWRMEVLTAVYGLDCDKVLIVMCTPLDECLRRNKNRKRRLPDRVITFTHRNYQTPTLEEGWDVIQEVKPNETDFTSNQIYTPKI